MEKSTKVQICSSLFLSKPSVIRVVAVFLLPCLVFTCWPSSRFSPFVVTIPILILSMSFLLTFTKNKKEITLLENPVQDENPSCDSTKDLVENLEAEEEQSQATENVVGATEKAAQESEVLCLTQEPADLLISDSESSGDSVSSENFEFDWMHCDNSGQNGVISSDSVSEDDEDGLIEIAIPGSDSTLSEEPKQKVHLNLPADFLPESIITQRGLIELLADINEVNEEENLIEIDISMGSIKCSKFEIEA